ncbi:MAG: hypothetical protein M3Y87_18590, partial [Myxococcota bacterium]|nr:hypothetical protein [Myxococcota bacterium]
PALPSTPPPATSLDPSLDALIESALTGTRVDGAARALPAVPPQHEVAATLRALTREVAMCREATGGTVATRITVRGATGEVARVQVSGDAAQGDVERCVTRVVEQARFPRFANDELVVVFPYRL